MNIIALAAEDLNNLNLDIGGVIVDVKQVTEENSINVCIMGLNPSP